MTDTDLEERVRELEERVGYLEAELELSVDEERFERQIRHLHPSDDDFSIDTDGFGYYTATISVMPQELPHIAKKVDGMDDIGWEVKESREDRIIISVQQGLVNQ